MKTNILTIDSEIKSYLADLRNDHNTLLKNLNIFVDTLDHKGKEKYKDLLNDVEKSSAGNKLNFYLAGTMSVIEDYKNLMKKPKTCSFMGNKNNQDNTQEETLITNEYLSIASDFYDIDFDDDKSNNYTIKCKNCGETRTNNSRDLFVCTNCFFQESCSGFEHSYADIERVNISTKYVYDRKSHFKECINNYQGKITTNIPDDVYKNLEEKFKFHGLIDENATTKKEKYNRISKNTIMIFLKELKYGKHYENLNYLYFVITGKEPDNISHLTQQLLNDFDILSDLYNDIFKDINRKNFINTQYVLFQLLKKYKHPCSLEDFVIIKTNDRKVFHEYIIKTLFEHLNWNYTSIF